MPRLIIFDSALRDLAEIAMRIERESQRRETAEAFIDKLGAYFERLANYPI